jgi:endonuclease YncB( thermonuclease family)
MPMLLIEGSFRIIGSQPDGDSMRFYPNDPTEWDRVEGPHRVRRNAGGGAQLRFDGIDTLETHYPSKLGPLHQPLTFGHAAVENLLR